MEPLTITALVLQTIVIVGAVFASFVRTRERIVVLETRTDQLEKTTDNLVGKVDGISRHVAKVEAST